MEAGFNRVSRYPSTWFQEQLRHASDLYQRHRAKFNALLVGLPASVAAAAAAHYIHYGMCLFARLFASVSGRCVCAASVPLGASVLTGVAVGGVVSLAIYGLIKVFGPKHGNDMEERRRAGIDRMVQALRKVRSADLLGDVTAFANCCSSSFCQPTFVPEDICLICHDEFDPQEHDADAGRRPVRALRCAGKHFMHDDCWKQWLNQPNRSMQCPSCGI